MVQLNNILKDTPPPPSLFTPLSSNASNIPLPSQTSTAQAPVGYGNPHLSVMS